MGYNWTNLTGAVAGDANGYLETTTMANGAYTLIANPPTALTGRHVTVTRTVINAADTPGTITLVGIGPEGPQTEVIVPGAHNVVVTSTKFFSSLVSATQASWALGAATADTIVIGWDNVNVVAVGSGTLHSVTINTAGAAAIYIGDSRGKIASIPSNQAAGTHYLYDINWSGFLEVDPGTALSDITVAHSGSMPSSYAMV
jgi:hypothetical protein